MSFEAPMIMSKFCYRTSYRIKVIYQFMGFLISSSSGFWYLTGLRVLYRKLIINLLFVLIVLFVIIILYSDAIDTARRRWMRLDEPNDWLRVLQLVQLFFEFKGGILVLFSPSFACHDKGIPLGLPIFHSLVNSNIWISMLLLDTEFTPSSRKPRSDILSLYP